jgi:hypothetical protein
MGNGPCKAAGGEAASRYSEQPPLRIVPRITKAWLIDIISVANAALNSVRYRLKRKQVSDCRNGKKHNTDKNGSCKPARLVVLITIFTFIYVGLKV